MAATAVSPDVFVGCETAGWGMSVLGPSDLGATAVSEVCLSAVNPVKLEPVPDVEVVVVVV